MGDKKRKGPSKLSAVGLSLICPGLGHLYLKQWIKAIVFLSITGVSLWKISEPMRVVWKIYQSAYPVLLEGIQSGNIPDITVEVEWMKMIKDTLLWGAIFTVVFIWALIDAFISAKKLQRQAQRGEENGNT